MRSGDVKKLIGRISHKGAKAQRNNIHRLEKARSRGSSQEHENLLLLFTAPCSCLLPLPLFSVTCGYSFFAPLRLCGKNARCKVVRSTKTCCSCLLPLLLFTAAAAVFSNLWMFFL
jgi:hypothetical protein